MGMSSIRSILNKRYLQLFIKPACSIALLSFLFILLPLSYSLLTKNIIDNINKHYISVIVIEIIAVYFLLIIIESLINLILQKLKTLNEIFIFKHLNKKLFRKMFLLPFIFFENESSGKIVDQFWSIERMAQLLFSGIANNIIILPMLIIILIAMFIINIELTLIAISFIAFQLIIVQYFLKQINKAELQLKVDSEELFSFLAEHIYNIESIKLESKENYAMTGLLSRQNKYKNSKNKIDSLGAFLYTINFMSNFFSFILILGFGLYELHNNRFSLGLIFAYQILYSMLFMYAKNLIGLLQSIALHNYNFKSINNIFKHSRVFLQNIKKDIGLQKYYDLEKDNPINIKLNNVGFSYNSERDVLKNICLDINYGQHVVLVGKNGSGKSTLLKILAGLYQPTSGGYTINDINMANMNSKSLKNIISYMDQNTILFMGSLKENLTLWNDAIQMDSIISALNVVNLDYLVNTKAGIQGILNENGSNLSSGERQRLEFARLLIRQSKIILIDEGTSNLDENTQNNILASLKKLKNTIIQVAHRMTIARLADMIYVIDNGCIIDYGNHQQLMLRCAIYQELVKEESNHNAV